MPNGYNPLMSGFHQGMQAGQWGLQQMAAQEERKQRQLMQQQQLFFRFADQVRQIDALPLEAQEPYYQLLGESFKQATGTEFPKPLLDAFRKNSAEQNEMLLGAVGQLAQDTGFDPKLLGQVLRQNPGALAGLMGQAMQAKKAAEEQEALRATFSGAGAGPAAGPAPASMGEVTDIDRQLAILTQSPYAQSPAFKGRIDFLMKRRDDLAQQTRHAQTETRMAQQHAEAMGMQRANLGMRQKEYGWRTSQQAQDQRLEFAQQMAGVRAAERPLPQGAIEEFSQAQGQMNLLTRIDDLLMQHEGAVGKIGGRVGSVKEFFGVNTEGEQALRTYVSEYKAAIAKARGGSQFTAHELKMLESYTPNLTDQPSVVRSKIEAARSLIAENMQSKSRIYQQSGYANVPAIQSQRPQSVGLENWLKKQDWSD